MQEILGSVCPLSPPLPFSSLPLSRHSYFILPPSSTTCPLMMIVLFIILFQKQMELRSIHLQVGTYQDSARAGFHPCAESPVSAQSSLVLLSGRLDLRPSYVEFLQYAGPAAPLLDLSAYTSVNLWLLGLLLRRARPSPYTPARLLSSRIRYLCSQSVDDV